MIRFSRRRHLARYRQIARALVKHGFGYLLDQLGVDRRIPWPKHVLRREERGVEHLPPAQHFRLALEELGPTFIKLGQIVSTRPDLLPPDFIAELTRLQDRVPPAPWPPVSEEIEQELGAPLEDLFSEFEMEPVAAASLGQVHWATLHSGDEVVVKVQRPNIEEIIQVDLEIIFDLARLAQERTSLGGLSDLEHIAEEFAFTLRGEMDYRREGRNADHFGRNFAHEPYLYIPEVYWDYTTERVLTLERISGIKIDDITALDAAGVDRHQVALNAARIIIKEVLEDGFFHADPHPGNFFVLDGAVIGAMDFGMVGYLSADLREDLVRLLVVSVGLDAGGIVDQLVRMSAAPRNVDREGLKRDLSRLLTKYYGLPLKEIRAREVMEEVMPIAFHHRLQFPSELWLLGKTLAMMEGVGLALYPDFEIFAVAEPHVRRFLRQMASPRVWGNKLLRELGSFGDSVLALPQHLRGVLERMEAGEFRATMRLERSDDALSRLDRMANRVAISLLVAAFIVALALLMPIYVGAQQGWVFALLVLGLVSASFLGLWLLFSIWRAGSR